MLFTFLLVVQAIVAAMLVTVVLMQRSEGGGLTSSGSPAGLMSARGAADFLTRMTAILATIFISMSILLAFLAATRQSGRIDTSLQSRPAAISQPAQPVPAPGNSAAPATLPLTPADNSAVPIAQ
jgi:preprotein translocase subunit SecG